MMRALSAVVALLVVAAAAQTPIPPTPSTMAPTPTTIPMLPYNVLAIKLTPPSFDLCLKAMPNITMELVPGDFSHNLREVIFDARDYIDIFCYAFPVIAPPNSTDKALHKPTNDIFYPLRHDLAQGFQLIGDFDDLSFVNYTEKDRVDRLVPLYEWRLQFQANAAKMSYSAYLQKISPDQLFIRPKEDLTYEFWGSSEAVPSVSLTGAQNIALLVQGQMETATKRYPIVFNITKIWKTDKVNEMHDFRKLIRGGFIVYQYHFPFVFQQAPTFEEAIIYQTYHLLGHVHDTVNLYHYFKDHGQPTLAEQYRQQAVQFWQGTITYTQQNHLTGCFQTVIDRLVPTGKPTSAISSNH